MEEKNLKFGQLHIIIQGVLIAIMLLYSVDMSTRDFLPGILALAACIAVDILILPAAKANRTKLLIGLRIIELLIVSALCVFLPSTVDNVQVSFYLIICVRMLEIIYLFDFSDAYARIISVCVLIFPLTVMVLIELLLDQMRNPGSITTMGSVAVLIIITIIVAKLSDIFTGWISKIEKNMFEQRRMAENAKEMNETLRIHQEKIRKANEELGIQRIRMESANRLINKANNEMKTQNELLEALTSCFDIPSIAKAIPDTLCSNLKGLVFCAIVLSDENRNGELVYGIKTDGLPEEFDFAFKEEALKAILTEPADELVKLDKELTRECYLNIGSEKELQAVAEINLIRNDEVIGKLFCGSHISDYFDESEGLLENIATQLNLGLKNVSLYAEVQRMAITDGLTRLYNRRKLNEIIHEYSEQAVSAQVPLSVAMLDIDHFKIFNDTYGHACGDMVLTELAKILDKWSREYGGIAARYGGEEFVMAFMNCEEERISEVLRRVKQEIDNSVYFYEDQRISIRVSMGYSCYPETTMNINRILNNADVALYYSKEHGRNRITVDSPAVLQYMEEREKTGK